MTISLRQVKPLLQVANNDDKLKTMEDELKKISDRFDEQKAEYGELSSRYGQVMDDKNLLSEQLQAETELCAEAEEVGWRDVGVSKGCSRNSCASSRCLLVGV